MALRASLLLIPLLLFLLLFPSPLPYSLEIEEILNEVSQIRKLDPLREIPTRFISREELVREVEEWFSGISQDEWKFTYLAFKALHLLPWDMEVEDLKEAIHEFYGGRILGYYDPETGEIVIVQDEGEDEELAGTLAHELAHALAHQHFPKAFCDFDLTDQVMAVDALLEGDAIIVESLWEESRPSASIFLPSVPVALKARSPASNSTDIPYGVALFLYFPYLEGPNFVQYLLDEGGWEEVNEAYRDLPRSTEQILHPQKYGVEEPEDADLRLEIPPGWRALGEGDRLGEFSLGLMFWNGGVRPEGALPYSSPLSSGWAWDEFWALEGEGGKLGYIWGIIWDSSQDAQEFVSGYLDLLGNLKAVEGDECRVLPSGECVKILSFDRKTLIAGAPDPESLDLLLNSVMGRISGEILAQGRREQGEIEISGAGFLGHPEPDGGFSLSLPPGEVKLTFRLPGYLPLSLDLVLRPWEDLDLGRLVLRGGDADGNERIELRDLLLMSLNFGRPGPSDITGDGITDIYDLVLAGGNLGAGGI